MAGLLNPEDFGPTDNLWAAPTSGGNLANADAKLEAATSPMNAPQSFEDVQQILLDQAQKAIAMGYDEKAVMERVQQQTEAIKPIIEKYGPAVFTPKASSKLDVASADTTGLIPNTPTMGGMLETLRDPIMTAAMNYTPAGLLTPLGEGLTGGYRAGENLAKFAIDKALGGDNVQLDPLGSFVKGTEEAAPYVSYRPKTEAGEAIQKPMEWLGEGSKKAGEKVQDLTGSPELGAATEVGLQLAPFVAGGMAFKAFKGAKAEALGDIKTAREKYINEQGIKDTPETGDPDFDEGIKAGNSVKPDNGPGRPIDFQKAQEQQDLFSKSPVLSQDMFQKGPEGIVSGDDLEARRAAGANGDLPAFLNRSDVPQRTERAQTDLETEYLLDQDQKQRGLPQKEPPAQGDLWNVGLQGVLEEKTPKPVSGEEMAARQQQLELNRALGRPDQPVEPVPNPQMAEAFRQAGLRRGLGLEDQNLYPDIRNQTPQETPRFEPSQNSNVPQNQVQGNLGLPEGNPDLFAPRTDAPVVTRGQLGLKLDTPDQPPPGPPRIVEPPAPKPQRAAKGPTLTNEERDSQIQDLNQRLNSIKSDLDAENAKGTDASPTVLRDLQTKAMQTQGQIRYLQDGKTYNTNKTTTLEAPTGKDTAQAARDRLAAKLGTVPSESAPAAHTVTPAQGEIFDLHDQGKLNGGHVLDAVTDSVGPDSPSLHQEASAFAQVLRKLGEKFGGLNTRIHLMDTSNPIHAQALTDFLLDHPRFADGGTHEGRWAGFYDPNNKAIFINGERNLRPMVLIHEVAHAITHSALSLGEDKRLPTQQQMAYNHLSGVFEALKPHLEALHEAKAIDEFAKGDRNEALHKFNRTYGLTNLHELISELYSNPEFRNHLRSLKLDTAGQAKIGLSRTVWGKINNMFDAVATPIKRMLGLSDKASNGLDALFAAHDQFFNSFSDERARLVKEHNDRAGTLPTEDPDNINAHFRDALAKFIKNEPEVWRQLKEENKTEEFRKNLLEEIKSRAQQMKAEADAGGHKFSEGDTVLFKNGSIATLKHKVMLPDSRGLENWMKEGKTFKQHMEEVRSRPKVPGWRVESNGWNSENPEASAPGSYSTDAAEWGMQRLTKGSKSAPSEMPPERQPVKADITDPLSTWQKLAAGAKTIGRAFRTATGPTREFMTSQEEARGFQMNELMKASRTVHGMEATMRAEGASPEAVRSYLQPHQDDPAKAAADIKALDQYPNTKRFVDDFVKNPINENARTLAQLIYKNPNARLKDLQLAEKILDNPAYTMRGYQPEAYTAGLFKNAAIANSKTEAGKPLTAEEGKAKNAVDNLRGWVKQNLIPTPEMRAGGTGTKDMGQLRNMAKALGLKPAQILRSVAKEDKAATLVKWINEAVPEKDINTAIDRLAMDIAGITKSGTSVVSRYYRGARFGDILTVRESVPPEIQAVWGKIQDPASVVVQTLMKQARGIAQLRQQFDIKDKGLDKWLFDSKVGAPDGYTAQLNGPKFGPLGGLWTTPEHKLMLSGQLELSNTSNNLMQALHSGNPDEAFKALMAKSSVGVWSKAVSLFKAKRLITDPGYYIMYAAGGPSIMAIHGIVNPVFAARGALAHFAELSPKFLEALPENLRKQAQADLQTVIKSGMNEFQMQGEIMDEVNARKTAEALANGMQKDPLSVLGHVSTFLTKARDAGMTGMSLTDGWAKRAALLHRVDVLKSFYERTGAEMSPEEIRKEAADWVKDTTITSSRTPVAARFLEKVGASQGLIYGVETIRNGYNAVAHGVSDFNRGRVANDPVMMAHGIKQLSGTALAIGGMGSLITATGSTILAAVGIQSKELDPTDDRWDYLQQPGSRFSGQRPSELKDGVSKDTHWWAPGDRNDFYYQLAQPVHSLYDAWMREKAGKEVNWGDEYKNAFNAFTGTMFNNSFTKKVMDITGLGRPNGPRAPGWYKDAPNAFDERKLFYRETLGVSDEKLANALMSLEDVFHPGLMDNWTQAKELEASVPLKVMKVLGLGTSKIGADADLSDRTGAAIRNEIADNRKDLDASLRSETPYSDATLSKDYERAIKANYKTLVKLRDAMQFASANGQDLGQIYQSAKLGGVPDKALMQAASGIMNPALLMKSDMSSELMKKLQANQDDPEKFQKLLDIFTHRMLLISELNNKYAGMSEEQIKAL